MENLLEGLQTERKAVEDERFHLNMERVEAEYQRKQLEEERHARRAACENPQRGACAGARELEEVERRWQRLKSMSAASI